MQLRHSVFGDHITNQTARGHHSPTGLFSPPPIRRATKQVAKVGFGVRRLHGQQPTFAYGSLRVSSGSRAKASLMSATLPSIGETMSTAAPPR
jgi:hypothetical protein